jgi:membrane protein implicated in regulation of membrane protease activity
MAGLRLRARGGGLLTLLPVLTHVLAARHALTIGAGLAAIRAAIAIVVGAAAGLVALSMLPMLAVIARLGRRLLAVALMALMLAVILRRRRRGRGGLRHGGRGDRKRDRSNEDFHVETPG